MNLMKAEPEKIGFVAPAMPPVKDERGDEARDESAERRGDVRGQMKE
jgi:hypothetical protein